MKSLFGDDTFEKLLKLLALGNFAFGLTLLLFPEISLEQLTITGASGPLFFQVLGLLSIAFGVGYLIASLEPARHYAVISVGSIFRGFFILLLLKAYFFNEIGLKGFVLMTLYLTVGLAFLVAILFDSYEQNTKEESAPKQFYDLIKYVRTNKGQTLLELSEQNNVLLIFIRHFGCTFCRETVSEIAKLDSGIKGKNLTPVFIHMSDPDFADEFFARYYDHPVLHVSDPSRVLFRSLGLKRGTLWQLFGPKVVFRGFWAGFFKGHGLGAFEGDFLQLGGYFVLSKGQVVFEHKTRGAADFFKIDLLPQR